MADTDDDTSGARFRPEVPAPSHTFPLKGCGGLDWGMQSRLARIFRPATSRTVMLAIDHGYFQGPTTGLERVDLSIVPLLPFADALMTTRGMVRSTVPPASRAPIVLRASGGPSILKELSDEHVAVSMEDAARINACAVAVQVFIGGEFEAQSVHNMTRLVDAGQRYGIPVLAVTAVGKELTRDARYLRLATRICAELGAHFVKTYYCAEDFDTVAAGCCPVTVVPYIHWSGRCQGSRIREEADHNLVVLASQSLCRKTSAMAPRAVCRSPSDPRMTSGAATPGRAWRWTASSSGLTTASPTCPAL